MKPYRLHAIKVNGQHYLFRKGQLDGLDLQAVLIWLKGKSPNSQRLQCCLRRTTVELDSIVSSQNWQAAIRSAIEAGLAAGWEPAEFGDRFYLDPAVLTPCYEALEVIPGTEIPPAQHKDPERVRLPKCPASPHRLERKGRFYLPEEVLPFVLFEKRKTGKSGLHQKRDFDGDLINMASSRLQMFVQKGLTCVVCGLTGTHFVKERSLGNTSWHFNLYGMSKNGKSEVLMTKDHIVPVSKGGPDRQSNFQPMCFRCNNAKGNQDE